MEPFLIGVRAAAILNVIISTAELVFMWCIRDPIVQPDFNTAEIIISEVLVLQILAAIHLFVVTLPGNPAVITVYLCKCWLILNGSWVCLEVVGVALIIFILLTMGRVYGGLLARWTSTLIIILQIEMSIRLVGIYVVIKFIEKLKPATVITATDIPLHALPEAVPINA